MSHHRGLSSIGRRWKAIIATVTAMCWANTLNAQPASNCCTHCSPYGDGVLGNLVVGDGVVVTLDQDSSYHDVTVENGGKIDTRGYILRVCGTLYIESEGVITDEYSGGDGGDGGPGGAGADPLLQGSPPDCLERDADCESGGDSDDGDDPLIPQLAARGKGGRGGGGGGGGGGGWTSALFAADADGGDGGDGGKGGKGGGYVRIYAYRLENHGVIHADGQDGEDGNNGAPPPWETCGSEYWSGSARDIVGGGGGGGGGGCGGNGGTVEIYYDTLVSLGTRHANGGASGLGGSGGASNWPQPLLYGAAGGGRDPGCDGGEGCGDGGSGGDGENRQGFSGRPGNPGANGQLSVNGACSQTHFVCPCAVFVVPRDFATIQAALDSAQVDTCDVIELEDGRYTGPGNCDIIFSNKCITLRSQSGDPSRCVIDGGGISPGFRFVTLTEISLIEGIGIVNCAAYNGGAVYCEDASPQFYKCSITGNHAYNLGGGLYLTNGSSVQLESCTVSGNSAGGGGGGGCGTGGAHCFMEYSILWGNCANPGSGEDWLCDGGTLGACCCDIDPSKIDGNCGIFSCPAETHNIHQDPLFCDPEPCINAPTNAGDYHLRPESPCADDPLCGLIGALGVDCQACCYPGGGDEILCMDSSEAACLDVNGDALALGVYCTPPKACILPDYTCIVTSTVCCENAGGEVMTFDECLPPQACCIAGCVCEEMDPRACSALGGVPQGHDVMCAGVTCRQACCHNDCLCNDVASPNDCLAAGDILLGPGSKCEDGLCCSIPTVSEWGLIVLTLLLLTAGTIVLRKGFSRAAA